LAEYADLSASHLHRLFKAIAGVTPSSLSDLSSAG
jgi:methylphosphotriester-DNA--protein-cysteine methyltransferase